MSTDLVVIADADPRRVILSSPTANREYPIPAGLADTSLSWIVEQTSAECVRAMGVRPATLVIPTAPDLPRQDAPRIGRWTVTGLEHDRGWYQLTPTGIARAGMGRINLCVLDRLSGDFAGELFGAGWEASRITASLRAYHELVGVPYYVSAGVSGIGLMREVMERQTTRIRPPRWHHRDPLAPELPQAVDLRWQSEGASPRTGHRWDIRAAYLAAAGAAQLGTDLPRDMPTVSQFDSRMSGWWRTRTDHAREAVAWYAAGPPLWDVRQEGPDGWLWLSTPLMAVVAEQRLTQTMPPATIEGAYLSEQSHRHLRGWTAILRDARYSVDGDPERYPAELDRAVKRSYTHAVGLLRRPGGRVHRPDWQAQIVDLARANVYRKIVRVGIQAGCWPDHVDVDSMWYPAEPVTAYELRTGRLFSEIIGESTFIGRPRYEGYETGKDEG